MRDENKTKSQLISELQELHRRLQNCEQAEAEIHRLASFPQLNPNPVVELDATGAVTFCNEAALATLKSLDESAGPEAFFPPDLEDILQAARERGERSFSREVRIKEAVFAIDISYAAPFEVLRLYTRDITERKRAEGALRETQKDLNRAQAVAHTGSWRLNIQRNELLWSDETYRIFGLPQGRPLTYESFLTAVHPEDRDYVDRKWQAALRGEAYDLEHRIMVGDTVKWVRERAELEFDPQGALIGGFGTVQDVTERKRGEAALRESEERLRLFIEHAPATLAMFDQELRFLSASRRWLSDYHLDDDNVLGRSVYEVFPELPERWKEAHRRALAGEVVRSEADYFKRADGLVQWFQWEVRPWYGPTGRVAGIVVFTEDITRRKQAEEALQLAHDELELHIEERTFELEETVAQLEEEVTDRQRAEESLRWQAELLDLTHDAIIVRDLNSRMVFWSRGAEETYGWQRDEALGQTSHILLQTKFPVPRREIELKVLQQGQWSGELTQVRADGTSIIVASRWALQLDEVGQPVAMLEINRDITKRKRAENILEARLRLLKLAESHTLEDFPQATLDELEGLTGSAISFYHLVEPDQQTLALQTWSTNTLEHMCTATGRGRHYDLAEAGVWVDCVRQRRPVIHNNYEALPHRRGLPPGHAPVVRELVVPIFREDQIVAIIGVGNKPSDYDEGDVEMVSLLGDFWWDIIERKRAEEALVKHAVLVQDLYNNAPCGYHSLDREGRLVQINDTELAWLGYTREEVLGGMKLSDLLTPASRETFRENFPGFVERGWIRDVEYELIRKDGTILPVLVNATAINDDAGHYLMSRATMVDLTERKRAEQALEAERRRFFAVLERIPAYVALISPDTRIAFANREFIRRFGEPKDRHCHELLFGSEALCKGCKVTQVFETGTPTVWEMAAIDGNTYQVYAHPFTDSDGSPLVLELGVDISHLKSIEDGLRRQGAILDGINRIFREALTCETEAQLGRTCLTVAEELTGAAFGTIYEVNAIGLLDALVVSERGWAACRMEPSGDQVLPKNLQVRGLYRQVIQEGISMIINDPAAHSDRIGTPEGHPTLTAVLEVPLWHGDTVMGLLCLGNKAGGFHPADQEAAETLAAATVEALRRFRAEKQAANLGRLYRVLSKVNEVIVRAPDQEALLTQACQIAVQEGGFLMAWIGLIDPAIRSVKAVAHYGIEEGYLEDLQIPLEDVPESQGPTGVAVREGRIDLCNDFATEPRMAPWREKALARGYRSSGAFPLRVGSQVVGALTLYAGIPEFFNKDEVALLESLTSDLSFAMESMDREVKRRQAEEEIRRLNERLEDRVRERTAELEFANREMESFSYSVSHDLKAPLRAIQGFSRMLLGEQADRLDQEGLRLLNVIISNTKIMTKLIDDLLALSRLGRHQLRKSIIDLAAMARQIFDQLKAQESGRNFQLTVSDLPPAWGDHSLLNQVMANLLDNAVKYTRTRQTAVIEMGGYTKGRENIYFIKDNGIGFDERYVHKLFGVFQRLHGSSEYEGTGVGLAIVQRIIQRHGGRVWADGKTGAGATFYFALPSKGLEYEDLEVTP